MSAREYFLAKGGRVFGPFDQKKYEALHASGEIRTYSWLWDEKKGQWNPIDPPPPALNRGERRPAPAKNVDAPPLAVLCYDDRNAGTGILNRATEIGCEWLCLGHSAAPPLASRTRIYMDLHNPKTGESSTIQAQVHETTRCAQGWIYHLSWDHPPSILSRT